MGVETIVSGALGVGSLISGKKQRDAQKDAAARQYEAQQQAMQQSAPLPVYGTFQEGVGADERYLVSPTVTTGDYTRQEAFTPSGQYGTDLGLVRERVEQRLDEGISPEQQQMMMRQFRTEAARTGEQQARGFQQGQLTGGFAGSRQAGQERIIARMAQQVAQNAFNLQMQSLNQQRQAEQDLLEIGRVEEARQLSIERENIARDIANNQIEQIVRNENIQNVTNWNDLMLKQHRIASQQAQGMAEATAQYQANMLQASQGYYSNIANLTSQISNTVGQYGAYKQQKEMQQDYFAGMRSLQEQRNDRLMFGTTSSTPSNYTGNMTASEAINYKPSVSLYK